MKIDVIFGTRPEWLKLYPLIDALGSARDRVRVRTILTGQQLELVQPLLDHFHFRPDLVLGDLRVNGALSVALAGMLTGLDRLLADDPPDWVLVQGDTLSTFAGTLAAYYRRLPVAHVEAGLRTHDLDNPWPEEFHRRVLRLVADVHFCPTPLARENLLQEGVAPERALVTGNTSMDMLRLAAERESQEPALPQPSVTRNTFLVTLHRRENLPRLDTDILPALEDILARFPDLDLLCVLHPGPAGEAVQRRFASHPRIRLTAPLPYSTLLALLPRLGGVLTDSGGLSEECAALGIPALIVRRATERVESLYSGHAALVGNERDVIVAECAAVLQNPAWLRAAQRGSDAYGDGFAAQRIVSYLLEHHP